MVYAGVNSDLHSRLGAQEAEVGIISSLVTSKENQQEQEHREKLTQSVNRAKKTGGLHKQIRKR